MWKIRLFELLDTGGSFLTELGYLRHYTPKASDIVLDCGSYFGQFAIKLARQVGPKGKVISFEPDERNYIVQKQKISESGLKNIILVKKALFDRKTRVPFKSMFQSSYLELNDFTGSSHIDAEERHTVECATLDSELARLKIKKVDFIKMDVEGAELEALRGAKKTLAVTKQMAIACYHIRNGKTTGRIMTPMLRKIGFLTSIGFPIHPTLYAARK